MLSLGFTDFSYIFKSWLYFVFLAFKSLLWLGDLFLFIFCSRQNSSCIVPAWHLTGVANSGSARRRCRGFWSLHHHAPQRWAYRYPPHPLFKIYFFLLLDFSLFCFQILCSVTFVFYTWSTFQRAESWAIFWKYKVELEEYYHPCDWQKWSLFEGCYITGLYYFTLIILIWRSMQC